MRKREITGLLLLVLWTLSAATLGAEVAPSGPTCSLQDTEVMLAGTCALSDLPESGQGRYRCVEISPVHCPHDIFVQEGSVCVHSLGQQLTFNCTAGKWTRTDSTPLIHREKRFWGLLVAVGCLLFCGQGGGGGGDNEGPPPNHPPEIKDCPDAISIMASAGKTEATVKWSEPTASDPDGGKPTIRMRSGSKSGSVFREGTTYVTYEAKDSGGLTDTCYFSVTVSVITCPVARAPRNGRRPTCSGAPRENVYGAVCTYSCDSGYILKGQKSLTCQQSGAWNHAEPQCEAVSCGIPGLVSGGTVSCLTRHNFPAVCSIICNSGYRHTGSVFTSCKADGTWSPVQKCADVKPPKFTSGCPPSQQTFSGPLGAAVNLTWVDPATSDNSGGTVTLTSSPVSGSPFLPGIHTVRITATDPEGNAASCMFFISIQVRSCQSLWITNGRVACDNGYMEGSKCTVSCNHGYQIQGQTTLTCQDNTTWAPALPTCDVITCPSPPVVQAGSLVCSSGHQYQSACYLVCQSGYTAHAPFIVTCSGDGNWTPPGTCLDTEQPTFDDGCPENIDVYASHLGEETIAAWAPPTVSDNSGEAIIPTSDIISGATFPVGVTYVTYSATDSSNNTLTCRFSVTVTTLSCGSPDLEDPARTRSLMLYDCPDGHVYGAECALNCTNGYPLLGSNAITCKQDNSENPPLMAWEFNGTKPECLENQCPKLNPPDNGALSCLLGNFGWDCFMLCNDNWDVVASFDGKFICTNSEGFWRPPTVPDCQVAFLPSRAKLPSALYYFTGSCEMSLDQIRTNFITALLNSTWKDACVNVATCTAENVQVTCGPLSRRKRSIDSKHWIDSGHGRLRRAASDLALVVSFNIIMGYSQNGTSENTYTQYKSKEMEVWTALKADAESGHFNLGTLAPDARYTQFPVLSFDCPAGTMFGQREGTSKASCVGCSKGHYLANSKVCVECPLGQYTELDTATSCTPCPPGHSTLKMASEQSTDCKEMCTAGYFSASGLVPCQPCPPGQYQSHDRATTCDLCPAGTWTNLAASVSRNDCIAADVHLTTNITLRSRVTSPQSSLTVSAWFTVDQNSSIAISFQFNNLSCCPLVLHIHTENASDTWKDLSDLFSVPVTTLQVVPDTWLQVVLVTHPDSNNVTLYDHKENQLDLILPSILTSITVDMNAVVLRRKGAISGLRAYSRSLNQEEITASYASCTGNYSDIMMWSPHPRSVYLPSHCDAVDDCLSSPCSSKGVCENRVDGFWCHCKDGWSGLTCEVPPDSCYQHQCQNEGVCVPNGDTYTCSCDQQHSGDRCELNKVHGNWGDWGDWSQCSATCGGQQQRQRLCNNPAPLHGGNNCSGEGTETQSCGETLCAVDGGWGPWSNWTTCSATCGGGESTRSRDCDNPAPRDGGAPCIGSGSEIKACETAACPVHGGWVDWSEWTPCSSTCGDGTESRERSCNNPIPANGGDACDGPTNQTRRCNLATCPECSQLLEPHGTKFSCSESFSPYRKTCTLGCSYGYVSAISEVQYTCGQETSYRWNFERDTANVVTNHHIPSCTLMKTATSATSTTTVPYSNTDCGLKDTVRYKVEQNLQQLPCRLQDACFIDVQSKCDLSGSSRRRRSGGPVSVTVNLTADFNDSVTLDQNGNSSVEQYATLLSLVDQSAAMIAINDTQSLFTITVGNTDIMPDVNASSYTAYLVCPPGTSSSEGGCVDCPPGFYEESGQCVLCPLGQYQDQLGSTDCKACPDDLTWDVMGATDITQCLFPRQSGNITKESTGNNTPLGSSSVKSNQGFLIAATIGGFIGAVGIITAITVYWFKRKPSQVGHFHQQQQASVINTEEFDVS